MDNDPLPFVPPVVVYSGGLSHRAMTIQQARKWLDKEPDSDERLLVFDLLEAVIGEDNHPDLAAQARAWQLAHPPPEVNGVQHPDETYLLVQDLLMEVLAER